MKQFADRIQSTFNKIWHNPDPIQVQSNAHLWSAIRVCRAVFPNLFLDSAPFFDKQIFVVPPPHLAHISTQFFRIVYLGCFKMIKTRMSAKMHFTIELNLVS